MFNIKKLDLFIPPVTHRLQSRRAAFVPRGCGSVHHLLRLKGADEAADGGHGSVCLWSVILFMDFMDYACAHLSLMLVSTCMFQSYSKEKRLHKSDFLFVTVK